MDADSQGRVFSLIGAGATAMMPISLMIAGPLADQLGVRVWYVAGGAFCILVTIVAWLLIGDKSWPGGALGYVTKTIEVLLVIFLFSDRRT